MPTGQTIYTDFRISDSCKGAYSYSHLWGQIAQNPNFVGVVRRFPARRATYYNVHTINTTVGLYMSTVTKYCITTD